MLEIEPDLRAPGVSAADLLPRMDSLDARADRLRVPLLLSQMPYTLKVHIPLVRERLARQG